MRIKCHEIPRPEKELSWEMIVVEMKKLTKRYENFTALDRVDIRVRQGDIYGLIGDNGAGKTTLR